MTRRPRLLLLSNGHGEDIVAARLARELHEIRPDVDLRAFPTVGPGRAYRGGPARRVGPLRSLPSEGLTFERHDVLGADLRAGLVAMTLAQARDLRAIRTEVVVAVGDVWIEALGTLPRARRRYAVQTLLSVRMAGERRRWGIGAFRERFTLVERLLLRASYRRVYLRDDASADALRGRGVRQARSVGNPMMDGLDVAPLPLRRGDHPCVVLLPGSRRYANDALTVMLDALTRLRSVVAVLPWAGDATPTAPAGWSTSDGPLGGPVWHRDGAVVHVAGRFEEALAWAELAIGTSGTAHEQAAGRGVPVIAFPCGPSYRPSFLARQRRLLGDAVEIVAADGGVVADAVRSLAAQPDELRRRAQVGRDRMGPAGGARRIAAEVLADAAGALDRAADARDGPTKVASAIGDVT
ncbi:MAG: lipid-A-disaccharide synthase-related protein [Trueperaceae bacterium]|nr:lipid-A-disaccharide synthase-related protein [Trueperaceae bacterium]